MISVDIAMVGRRARREREGERESTPLNGTSYDRIIVTFSVFQPKMASRRRLTLSHSEKDVKRSLSLPCPFAKRTLEKLS